MRRARSELFGKEATTLLWGRAILSTAGDSLVSRDT